MTEVAALDRGLNPFLRSGRRYHQFSGGEGSWRAAKIDRLRHPTAEHHLVFSDTLYEDADTYRFMIEGAADVLGHRINWTVDAESAPDYRVSDDVPIEEYCGNPEWRAWLADLRVRAMDAFPGLIWLVEGRDPWEIFRDKRFLGNSLVDPCSRMLKREVIDDWRMGHCRRVGELFGDPDVSCVGIGFHEKHRFDDGAGGGIVNRYLKEGWLFEAPLIDAEIAFNDGLALPDGVADLLFAPVEKFGINQQRLYRQGYRHANCGGMCVKAGQAQWANRYRVQPLRYLYDAMMERKLAAYLGQEVSMLSDRRGGSKTPMSLDKFAERLRADPKRQFEYQPGDGGCGCTGASA